MDVLFAIPEVAGMGLHTIDIAQDERLMAQYGERIPVLRLGDACLDWPFTVASAAAFIARQARR